MVANPQEYSSKMEDEVPVKGAPKKSSQLLTARVFECYSLPPVNSFSGALVPRSLAKRRRKVSVEVHLVHAHVDTRAKKATTAAVYEECVVRILDPATDEEKAAAKKRGKQIKQGKHTQQSAASVASESYHLDGHSVVDDATTGASLLDAESSQYASPDFDKGWKAKYRFPVRSVSIKSTQKRRVMVQMSLGKSKEVRELIFDTQDDADAFQALIKRELSLENKRGESKMKAALGDGVFDANETVTYLIEIVSGWDLPAGDFLSSDPFVCCYLDGKEVHRTKYISKTLEPVWTIKTGSLFLLTVDARALFTGDGLKCIVYDYDNLGADEKLGMITFPSKQIYEAKGERLEFKLQPPPGKTGEVEGYLALRCRKATEYDKKFLAEYNRPQSKGDLLGLKNLERETDSKGGSSNIKSIMTRKTRTAKAGRNFGKKEYKVRPTPDPSRPDDTAWMTKKEIQDESLHDSLNWIDTGTGRLGRVFVEVIGCDNLPNMDAGGFAGNKTDAFVCLVYEDAVVRTDIIDDTLSPRWMPWSKRAFIFHMFHTSSELFLGVFDYDDSPGPADDHDLIGRVSVDLSNLRKNTMYTLKYNLYTTARMSQRAKNGTITIRVRIEVEDERKLLLSNLEPPPQMYVNVKTRKDFRVVQTTVMGKFNMSKYSMKVINSYIEELLGLQHVLFYMKDAFTAVILWHGTLPVKIGQKTYKFPIHSLSAFLLMTTLVERPQLVPSFFFASLAWLMLAVLDYRRRMPDIWSRCKSFREFIEILALGESQTPPASIKPHENYAQAQAFLEQWKARVKAAEEAAAKAYDESVKAQEEYEKEMEEIGEVDTDIATKSGGMSIDPFKKILYPVQQNLQMLCRYVRHVKYVLSWQECYISFWVTVGCILLSLICYFIPWFFFIKWGARVIVWVLFGPWMKLADIYYFSKIEPLSEEEEAKKKAEDREKRLLQTMAAAREARIKRENAQKLKAMKKYMFGKFIVGVPVLKEDRFRDLPLPDSSAVPYKPNIRPLSELAMQDAGYRKIRIPGQHLVGDMIPKMDTSSFTDAPIGQPTAQPNLIDREGPGGAVLSGKETTARAYAKIATLVLSAAILTWFGVPLMAALTERTLKLVLKA